MNEWKVWTGRTVSFWRHGQSWMPPSNPAAFYHVIGEQVWESKRRRRTSPFTHTEWANWWEEEKVRPPYWRRHVQISAIDEPTNDLNVGPVTWLEDIFNFRHTVRYLTSLLATPSPCTPWSMCVIRRTHFAGNYGFWYGISQLMSVASSLARMRARLRRRRRRRERKLRKNFIRRLV